MDPYERLKRAQEILGLSESEMALRLYRDEQEFAMLASNPSDEFCEELQKVLGIAKLFILEGKGPMFSWRPLPIKEVVDFVEERNWNQFHNPKDLAISINLEASELLECFQWSGEDLRANEHQQGMKEELADILIYCIQFAQAYGFDIPTIIADKIAANGKKYPVEQAWGNARKYTEFEE
ncbi:MAG: nucleotide pyrophosphohydrolase [Sphaerochaeta sp.]|jgi:NTP pyrophosphatase (non-canonical NTP hydrolase)